MHNPNSLVNSTLRGAGPISAKVFVGNLNYRTTKEELIAFLSPAGEIVDAFLPTDRETGRPRGFGFVTFASEEQAQACIEQFDGVEMGGRRLNINKADDRGRKPRRSEPATEFKRGGRGRGGPGGGGGGGRRDDRRGGGGGRGGPRPPRPPRGAAAPPPPEPEYTTEDRRDPDATDESHETDEWGKSSQPWKKKKKKSKGSRRGLRSKKRSL